MKKALLVVASIAMALMIVGCGGVSESDLVGSWTGKTDLFSASSSDSGTGDQRTENMVESMFGDLEVPLELKDDHTFTMTMLFLPAEGTWEFNDMKVTLTYTKMMSLDISGMGAASDRPPIVMTVSKDGETLEFVNPVMPEVSTLFTKKASD